MRKKVLGAGVFNFDTIVVREYPDGPGKKKFIEHVVREEIGGTCGNVMTMLPYLGVETYPVAIFDRSAQGLQMKEDLARYGADTRFVRNEDKGGTTLLRCTHKTEPDGTHTMSFRMTSPGSRFPRRKQLGALNGEAVSFAHSLDFVPDLFFFDDPAAGNMALARELRAKGTVVYFEPEGVGKKMSTFLKRVEVSDIVKFSGEKIEDYSFTDLFPDKLFIRTMGGDGLEFRLRGGSWIHVPAVANDNVVDWEGAGDWTSSAFIAGLLKGTSPDIRTISEETVKGILMEAQAQASKSVSFIGSKGMINTSR